MKKFLNFVTVISFFVVGCYPGRQVYQADNQISQADNYDYEDNYNNTDVTYQTFYDQLQPYGNWISYPEYGNVWQPNVREGFRPYETGGHWVSTVDGWAWASDYNWGWAPFHYGRWLYDQSIGWAWVPGYEWAPAWVTWGQYDEYYAWAPLAPGINVSLGNTWRAPDNYWSFVPRNYINSSNINRYVVRNSYNTNVNNITIINITIINNYNSYNQRDYYHRGPVYQEVERFTHKPITQVGIVSTKKPGLSRVVNKEFEVYRPALSPNAANNNGIPRRMKLSNETRSYNGAVNGTLQNEAGINQQNQNINKVPERYRKGALANGINNGDNVTRENIDNTNRQLQQQMENSRRMRTRLPADNRPLISESPVRTQQFPQNNQQNNIRRQVIRSNPPADHVQPSRPEPAFQNERNIQKPAFPSQNEKIMRQPQAPTMPNRVESREANPVRSMQTGRPGNFRRP